MAYKGLIRKRVLLKRLLFCLFIKVTGMAKNSLVFTKCNTFSNHLLIFIIMAKRTIELFHEQEIF